MAAPARAGMLVLLLAALVYLNVLPNAFVIDDHVLITRNTLLREPGGLKKIFATNAWASLSEDLPANFYRPLMHTTLWLWWRMCGQNPAGYHALSIAMHAAVSLLVFLCLRRLSRNGLVALVAALLFAVHPIHTEAVAWISSFPDVQSTLFVLLGLWLYLRAEEAGGWQRRALEAGVAACVLLALLAKEIGVTLPLLLLFAGRAASGRRAFLPRSRAFAYSAAGLAIVLYLVLRWQALGGLMPVASGYPGSRKDVLLGWAALLYEYVARLILPLRLSAFHVLPVCGQGQPCLSLLDARVLAGLASAVFLAIMSIVLYRRGGAAWLGALLFVVPLAASLPASLRPSGVWLGERYLYLPSVAFCWLVAYCLDAAARSARRHWPAARQAAGEVRILLLLGLMLTLPYAVRTVLRNQDWREEIPFYLHELRTEGHSPHLRSLLADMYITRGMPREASLHAREAVRLSPYDARAHNTLAFVHWLSGEPRKAIEEYELAARYAQRRGDHRLAARALNNVAVAYSTMGLLDLAIPKYRQALQFDPDYVEAHRNLGLALRQTGRPAEAEFHLRKAEAWKSY